MSVVLAGSAILSLKKTPPHAPWSWLGAPHPMGCSQWGAGQWKPHLPDRPLLFAPAPSREMTGFLPSQRMTDSIRAAPLFLSPKFSSCLCSSPLSPGEGLAGTLMRNRWASRFISAAPESECKLLSSFLSSSSSSFLFFFFLTMNPV